MRGWLSGAVLAGAVVVILGLPGTAAAAASKLATQAYRAGVAAYVHAYPPLISRASQAAFPVNALAGIAATSTPANELVVLPNVDTTYTLARLDLRLGPLVVHVPAMPGRYYSLQLMDAYTNVFGYIGTRVTGSGAGQYAIAGPGTRGAVAGLRTLHSPTPDAVLVGRALVRPSDTTPSLAAMLGSFAMTPVSQLGGGVSPVQSVVLDASPKTKPAALPAGMALLDAFDRLLTEDPPSGAERRVLAPYARFGIGPDLSASTARLSAPVRNALLRGIADGSRHLAALVVSAQRRSARRNAGWFMSGPRTGAAGSDWTLRAVVARTELWANTEREAVYPIAVTDDRGRPLSGRHRYALTFSGGPPARAFWSVTMYNAHSHLYANRLHRYALGDRSPGLGRARRGAVTLYLQHAPARDRAAWLPAPGGRFWIALRLYIPGAAVIAGRWTPPPVRCLDCR